MIASRLIFLQKLLADYPERAPVFGTRFAMGFLAELVHNPDVGGERRAIAIAGAELALPHVPPAKRAVLRAALFGLQAFPTSGAAFFRIAKPLRRLLQKPEPILGDGP